MVRAPNLALKLQVASAVQIVEECRLLELGRLAAQLPVWERQLQLVNSATQMEFNAQQTTPRLRQHLLLHPDHKAADQICIGQTSRH